MWAGRMRCGVGLEDSVTDVPGTPKSGSSLYPVPRDLGTQHTPSPESRLWDRDRNRCRGENKGPRNETTSRGKTSVVNTSRLIHVSDPSTVSLLILLPHQDGVPTPRSTLRNVSRSSPGADQAPGYGREPPARPVPCTLVRSRLKQDPYPSQTINRTRKVDKRNVFIRNLGRE